MAASAGGGAVRALSQKEQDIQMMLAADVHLGTKNCDFQMERYVFKRRTDGIYIINLWPLFLWMALFLQWSLLLVGNQQPSPLPKAGNRR
ncbi:40S ribosomal protein Sa-1 [Zea mays]|uniref:40S ribosomal protein Sa-1 n=1 Tax=Zea mays TaxID=4577 RepID=A0A1D6PIR3_MAIZE|nr:40S ribosomal protein Sa-1 [Zea mays]